MYGFRSSKIHTMRVYKHPGTVNIIQRPNKNLPVTLQNAGFQ